MMRRLALLVASCALTPLVACASLAPASCPDGVAFEPPPRLTCEVALAAARTQLMAVAGIRELSFDYDTCPPNARCPGPTGDEGEVIATLPTGEQLSVIVRVGVDGIVRAEEPVPVAGIEGVVER